MSQDKWDKTWGMIKEVRNTEKRENEREGMGRAMLESIKGFLIYVERKY